MVIGIRFDLHRLIEISTLVGMDWLIEVGFMALNSGQFSVESRKNQNHRHYSS